MEANEEEKRAHGDGSGIIQWKTTFSKIVLQRLYSNCDYQPDNEVLTQHPFNIFDVPFINDIPTFTMFMSFSSAHTLFRLEKNGFIEIIFIPFIIWIIFSKQIRRISDWWCHSNFDSLSYRIVSSKLTHFTDSFKCHFYIPKLIWIFLITSWPNAKIFSVNQNVINQKSTPTDITETKHCLQFVDCILMFRHSDLNTDYP